ncbi:MAG: SDR family NAD(P)-dependent oxidoreductase [Anaerolineae bacterium]|jgi:NAD(P)-dependent dehydrogenase (short-subunit alcohol dehydrogenase family)|nr:SDR family NAD(P)-dependent oxidoreductase [Anaerolineae bacterium]
MNPYFKQYRWSNIFAMLRNLRSAPAVCKADMRQRLVVITGATSGIGLETAKKYAAHGADVLSINRNEEKSKALCEMLKREYNSNCSYLIANFSSLADVHRVGRQLAELDREIDVLIHNVGAYMTRRTVTADQLETVFQTNYLSSFILNHAIKEKMKAQGHGRIIFVNSEAHRFAAWGLHLDDLNWEHHRYSGANSYGHAKLAQLLSLIKFDEYFSGSGVTINAMHPGNVKTNSGNENGPLYQFFKKNLVDRTAQEAQISAEALYYLGASSAVEQISGKFFTFTTVEEPAPPALDREAAEQLWQISLTLGGIQ